MTRAVTSRPVIIVGAGGHAAVVADALLASGTQILGFTDSIAAHHGRHICGVPVIGDDSVLYKFQSNEVLLANGIGGMGSEPGRRIIQQRLVSVGWRFATVCHPRSVISPFSVIAEGAQVLANSVVQVGASIEEGVIVNTAAVVEHHAKIGAWVHIAPGALICGGVVIGADSHVGAGAVVRQNVRVGNATLIGAGAVVVRDFIGGGVLTGIPAHKVGPKP